jgi:hypothetical protein
MIGNIEACFDKWNHSGLFQFLSRGVNYLNFPTKTSMPFAKSAQHSFQVFEKSPH